MDSGELEVVSLRREPLGGQRQRPSPSPSPPPRRSNRRRLLITCGCALALILATSGLLLSTHADPRLALGAVLGIPTATPTPPLAPGAAVLLVEHRVPWGVLTVDGKRNDVADVAQPPDPDLLDNPVSFLLSRGRHQVVYIAPPFAPLRCVVSVPAARGDTCPLAQPDNLTHGQVVGAARILDLHATLDHLPAQSLAGLVTAATAAIAISMPSVTASAGEHYFGADLQTHTFAQDTRVSLFREPWQGAPPDGSTGCQFLCPSSQSTGAPSEVWPLTAEVREGYHYVPLAAGAPPITDGPLVWTYDSNSKTQASLLDSVPLDVTWDGAWHVKAEPINNEPIFGPSFICQAAATVMANYPTGSGPTEVVIHFQPVAPAANQADGCAIGLQRFQPDGTVDATGALLYRFGVVLTTDTLSRSLFPNLPQADAAEQALVRQVLASAH